ncbi:MAG TPA: peptidoglycan editing factor PgeF [Ohtaekwangia sp.]|uniref:peptidoglycan editing factor PgeF n=1 Tax=Ohtaekwangia sp. TaxID=2066019 RepID=UPI002F926435
MKHATINGLNLWQFDSFSQEKSIKHFVTQRNSHVNGKEFTLSYSSSPDKAFVQHNRHLLAEAIGVADEHLYLPSQVHKTRVVHVTRHTTKDELMETDALITNAKGLCIAVMSADCVPIILYDRKHNAVAAVHSGWRGTVARILEKTLHEMHHVFGTKGEDVVAGIGPSVSQDSYEVGEEVVEEVTRAFGKNSGLLIPQANNKAKLDLWKANAILLREFGVKESAIEIADLCTVKNNDHFFSARKGDAGRFAAGIVLV